MIKNFENKTLPLKTEEKEIILPMLISGLEKRTNENPIKAPELVRKMNECLQLRGYTKIKFTEVRLRKLCNYIRSHSLLALMATSHGYYTTVSKKELQTQIDSLKERADAIMNCVHGLEKLLH